MTAPDAGLGERLTEDEREALRAAMGDVAGHPFVTSVAAVDRILATHVAAAEVKALREAAVDMEMFEPFPGEEPDWLRDRADRLAEGVQSDG